MRGQGNGQLNSPLSINFNASVAAIGVAVVCGNADVLLSPHAPWTVAVALADADVFTRVAVVSTGRALLVSAIFAELFPSSALDGDTLVALDLGGLDGSLLVLVGRREDAERDRNAGVEIQRVCGERERELSVAGLNRWHWEV